jgi:hypothetical protein
MTSSNTLRVAASLILLIIVVPGCGRRVNIPAWQQNVETFVKDQGAGDPSVLRDVTLEGTQRGFAIISHNHPAESTDARGVLLAHQEVAGKPRFIYLVGIVKKERVRDIRLAALSVENGSFNWRVGKEDDDALDAYREYNQRLWRKRFPDRNRPPVDYLGFPRNEDDFELQVTGRTIIAQHSASGARWELLISAKDSSPPAAQPPRQAAAR